MIQTYVAQEGQEKLKSPSISPSIKPFHSQFYQMLIQSYLNNSYRIMLPSRYQQLTSMFSTPTFACIITNRFKREPSNRCDKAQLFACQFLKQFSLQEDLNSSLGYLTYPTVT